MSGEAATFSFLGNAFLSPDAVRLADPLCESGESEFVAAITAAPLEPEFYRLFLNPAGTPCPPWQSAHGPERHLMGEPHLGALAWYRRFGVEPVTRNDPADHIGLLLMFYARLLEVDAAEEVRSRFAAEHLAWIPAFCDAIEKETRHPFYRLLAARTRQLATGILEHSPGPGGITQEQPALR
ncbi:MAG: molecular chaperone TorD family protein [Acidobacteria bacterium]|nr:molecular chaperone TorD family protein [Acidobacteriota bacterium]